MNRGGVARRRRRLWRAAPPHDPAPFRLHRGRHPPPWRPVLAPPRDPLAL